MNFVFETFTAILLARNQRAIFLSSELTCENRSARLLLQARPAVSSANISLNSLDALYRSLMYIRNRMGPNILPCITDILKVDAVDKWPSISTCCLWSFK
jgi:hypothetical protein